MAEIVRKVFCEVAKEWSLRPQEGWEAFAADNLPNTHQQSISQFVLYSNEDATAPAMCVRLLTLFGGETVVLYVSNKGRILPFHVSTADFQLVRQEEEDCESQLSVEKLRKHFNLTVFAPLLQPNKELPTLSLMSLTSLTNIFTYLSAPDLCQVGQACKALRAASLQDLLWQRLLEIDYAARNLSPIGSATGTSSATGTPAAGARERYRSSYLERARQRKLAAQQRQQRELHSEVLPPPWLAAGWGEVPAWTPALPPLRLPYLPGSPPMLGPVPHWPLPPGSSNSGFNVPAFEGGNGLL